MNTIHHYSNLMKNLSSMTSVLNALAYDFKETAPITELDEQQIDGLVASANTMLAQAEALKGVTFDPSAEDEESRSRL